MPIDLSQKSEQKNSNAEQDKKNISKIGEAANYIVVNFLQKKKEGSLKNKRVLVCIELDRKEKLKIKKYTTDSFEKYAENKNKKLAFYVKDSESEAFLSILNRECKELLVDLKDNNKIVAKLKARFCDDDNYQVKEFKDYPSMKHAFDEKTGEYNKDIIKRLKSYVDNAKEESSSLSNALNSQYSIALSPEDKTKLEKHMSEMEKILGQAESKNELSLSEKENELISIHDKFNAEIKVLSNKCSVQSLGKNSLELLEKCGRLIPKDAKFIAGEIITINAKIEELKVKLKELPEMIIALQVSEVAEATEKNIKDLTNKFEEYSNEHADLEKEIKKLVEKPEENTQIVVDEQERQTKAVMLKTYSEQIKPALLAIETHKEKTSEYKKGILERIITEIKQLEDEVKLSIKDTIKDKVSSIVSYINGNYNNLATPTGLFASKGTSGRLVQNLKSNLEIFMLAISQIETLSLEASPTLKP